MALLLGIDARLANTARRAGVGNVCLGMLDALPAVMGDTRLRLYLDDAPRDHLPIARNAEVRMLPHARFWAQRKLAADLRRDPPDVFWSPVLQLPLLASCPLIGTVHDLAVRRFPTHFTWRRRAVARLELRLAVWRAAHLCVDSEATKQDLEHFYRVSPDRVTVAHPGVGPAFHAPQHAADIERVRAAHTLPERFVLYVGRIQPRKNIVRLIEAFEQVVREHPGLPHHLVIAGDRGWLYDEVFARARASSAHARIRFQGFVPDEDLPALMAAADVLALVSLWEGFGLPVAEAMACGTAVLTSDCSSLPEVAGEAAEQVPPADTGAIAAALGRLLTDDTHRHALERRGAGQAARFTWNAAAARLMQAVRSVAPGA